MLKALIKKELLQLNQFYIYDRKRGKLKSKKGIIGTIVLFVFIFIMLGASFGGLVASFALPLIRMNLDWLFFAMAGLLATVLGVFGDVFNTYNLLYKSKDNDLMLSMPISPANLLAARLVGVFLMGLLYESLVFIPSIVVFWMVKTSVTATEIIFPIIVWLFIAAFVAFLTCVLGWFVALVSSKFNNKNFTKVLATVAFLVVYYIFYFKVMNSLSHIEDYIGSIENVISGWMFLSFHMGKAATGNAVSLFIYAAAVLGLFALAYLVMTRSYIKMTTSIKGSKKIEYHKKESKTNSIMMALVRKELKHFSSSSAYMMNLGLGLVISTGLAIFALIKTGTIRSYLSYVDSIAETMPWIVNAIPVVVAFLTMLLSSMNLISAPSLSLEGKNLWILQSAPLDGKTVFRAKIIFHIVLCFIPTFLLSSALCWVIKLSFTDALLVVFVALVFMLFDAVGGLWIDSKKYNFNWTNEVYPIKQGFSVSVLLLGGWAFIVILAGLYYLLHNYLSAQLYLGVLILLFALLIYLMYRNLMKTGTKEFSYMR